MDNKNIFENNKFSSKKIVYYVVLTVSILIIAAISFFSYKSIQNSLSNEKIENEVTDKIDTVDSNVNDVTEKTEENVSTNLETEKETVAKTETPKQPTPTVDAKAYIMPLKGEMVTPFSIDTPIYSQTLKDWRMHDGIDISADLGTNVVAVNDGAVERIFSDDLFGMVVVIKHTDGKKSTYSNLADNIEREEGQIINQGDIVGTVGNTAICEISDGPHLHFEMSENGKKIDPLSVIK